MADCRSCGQPVKWAETVPNGRKVPLDSAAVPVTARGALVVVGRYAYSYKELVTRLARREDVSEEQAAVLIAQRYAAHLSHFSTCPNANEHRQPKGKP